MIRKQKGLTMITWVVVLGLVAIQAVMAIRILPLYMSHNSLVSVMDGLSGSPAVKNKSANEVMKIFRKRLKINNLYDLANDKKAFKLKKIEGGYNLAAHYEARGPIFKNLEFVATFDHQTDIMTR